VFQQQLIEAATIFPTKQTLKRSETIFWLGQTGTTSIEVNAPHTKWNTTIRIHQNQYFSFKEKLYLKGRKKARVTIFKWPISQIRSTSTSSTALSQRAVNSLRKAGY